MNDIFKFFLTLLSQFAGGPGPVENNLVRFGLAAVFWAVLLGIAWSRQRTADLPREKLLVWGFGLALVREIYMVGQTASRIINPVLADTSCSVTEPIEHALAMVAIITVAGAFLRYKLDDARLSKRYLQVGWGIAILSLIVTALIWPSMLVASPTSRFHQTWLAWLFHLPLSLMILAAAYFLWRKPGWLRNVVTTALGFFFLSEVLFLINYSTSRAYAQVLCPIGNAFHILAIPLLGFVYLREQGLEKEQAEAALREYRDHLQELVTDRTAELTSVNERLTQEVVERRQAEEALARITQRDELILTSAGEGICGIDRQGHMIFINPAAAAMLGYPPDELVNQNCHPVWHRHRADGTPYPEEECPIYASYHLGIVQRGDHEYFDRKDGSRFPVRFFSNPAYEKGELAGAVLVFQDITERKRNEAQIARQMTSLGIQNDVAAALSQSLEIEVSIKSALDIVFERLSLQEGMVFLWDGERQYLTLSTYRGDKSPPEIQSLAEEGNPYWQISDQARSSGRSLVRAPSGEVPWTLVSTPLTSKGRAVGVITLAFSKPRMVGPYDLDLLTAVGQQMGMAVENARMYQEAEGWADDMTRLQEASAALTASFNEDHVTRVIAEQSARLMDCRMACVIRFDAQTSLLELVAQHGLSEADARLVAGELNYCDLLSGLSDRPQLISVQDTQADPRVPVSWREQLHLRSLLCLPVWGADHPLMYLCLFAVERHRYWKPQELELIESFASRAAVAVMNARLHKQLEMAAALEERQRIAADFHDGLAQTLSLLGLRVDQVSERLNDRMEPETLADLQTVRTVVNQASVDVRRSIASLREPPEPRASLQSQLTQLAVRQSDHGQAPIEFVDRLPQPLFISKDHLQQVLPLLQEAILNARNHAQAKTIRILLEWVGEELQITVEDDGVGFNPDTAENRGDHFGLSIMHARAGRMGARLQIQSIPGNGTRILLAWQPGVEGSALPVETLIQDQV